MIVVINHNGWDSFLFRIFNVVLDDWIILRYGFYNLSSSPSVFLGKMRWISDIVCIPEVVIWVVGYPSIICIVKIIMTLSHFLVQRRNSGHVFSFSMIACLMLFTFSFRLLVAMFLWETVVMRYVVAMRGIALWEVYCCYELCERYVVVAMGSVNGMLLLWALWKV